METFQLGVVHRFPFYVVAVSSRNEKNKAQCYLRIVFALQSSAIGEHVGVKKASHIEASKKCFCSVSLHSHDGSL